MERSISKIQYITIPTSHQFQDYFLNDLFETTNNRCYYCGRNALENYGSIVDAPLFICVDWGGGTFEADFDTDFRMNGSNYSILTASYIKNSHFTTRFGSDLFYDGMRNDGKIVRFNGNRSYKFSYEGHDAQMIIYKRNTNDT